MQKHLSADAIAIVASNLTAALCATGVVKVDDADRAHTILSIYWEFCAELEADIDRDRIARG